MGRGSNTHHDIDISIDDGDTDYSEEEDEDDESAEPTPTRKSTQHPKERGGGGMTRRHSTGRHHGGSKSNRVPRKTRNHGHVDGVVVDAKSDHRRSLLPKRTRTDGSITHSDHPRRSLQVPRRTRSNEDSIPHSRRRPSMRGAGGEQQPTHHPAHSMQRPRMPPRRKSAGYGLNPQAGTEDDQVNRRNQMQRQRRPSMGSQRSLGRKRRDSQTLMRGSIAMALEIEDAKRDIIIQKEEKEAEEEERRVKEVLEEAEQKMAKMMEELNCCQERLEKKQTFEDATHQFHNHTYHSPAVCGICHHVLLGVVNQGLQCSECRFNVHHNHKCQGEALLRKCCGRDGGAEKRRSSTTMSHRQSFRSSLDGQHNNNVSSGISSLAETLGEDLSSSFSEDHT